MITPSKGTRQTKGGESNEQQSDEYYSKIYKLRHVQLSNVELPGI